VLDRNRIPLRFIFGRNVGSDDFTGIPLISRRQTLKVIGFVEFQSTPFGGIGLTVNTQRAVPIILLLAILLRLIIHAGVCILNRAALPA